MFVSNISCEKRSRSAVEFIVKQSKPFVAHCSAYVALRMPSRIKATKIAHGQTRGKRATGKDTRTLAYESDQEVDSRKKEVPNA